MKLEQAKEIIKEAKKYKINISCRTRWEMLCEFERLLNEIR